MKTLRSTYLAKYRRMLVRKYKNSLSGSNKLEPLIKRKPAQVLDKLRTYGGCRRFSDWGLIVAFSGLKPKNSPSTSNGIPGVLTSTFLAV